jgi:threonine/homoserine/homoserine lactone efflux protein
MSELIPPWPLFGAFVIASLVLAVTPGPAVLYIVTRGATQGRLSALASVAGVALGNFGNALGASLGLAALFAVSSVAFLVVKYLGALYLVYLGVRALRTRAAPPSPSAPPPQTALRRVFADGFVVALLNPKTALFFAAFLPQFIATPSAPLAQTLALGVVFIAIAAVTDSVYALSASALRPWLQRTTGAAALGRYVSGAAFIGLGVFTALSGQRAPK